jgi:UDP-N-acetylmuramoyl-tripeptide--D-alanyl-D-alanine ligase
MKVSEILKITNGALLSGASRTDINLSKISTDSRAIVRGGFFIAIKGENFDGNDFVEEVFKKGAIGTVISGSGVRGLPPTKRWTGQTGAGKIIIQVKDTLKALQDIAAAHRRKFDIPVIAITGSNGKTTVKDMTAACLSKKYNVLKNEGTKNNHIGVPQTLLKLKPSHEACVLELGANHEGEIRLLSSIARPTIAAIINIGSSHLEFFKDLKGVYEAKKEIVEFLDKKGTLVLNGDDPYLSGIKDKTRKVLRYGLKKSNDFAAEALPSGKGAITFVVNKRRVFHLNIVGRHNIYNALAAIAVSLSLGVDYKAIREALFCYKAASARLDVRKMDGFDLIDDSYNSNPLSMAGALEAVMNYPASGRWIVAGDMLELGDKAVDLHRMAGEMIARSNIDGLFVFGELSKNILRAALENGMKKDKLWHYPTHDAIAGMLKKVVKKGDVVLLKGSRGMRMEKIIEKLKGR